MHEGSDEQFTYLSAPGDLLDLVYLKSIFKVAEHSFSYCTYVSFTIFSKTLDLLVAKNGSNQVDNTNFGFLIVKLTYMPLPWQHA